MTSFLWTLLTPQLDEARRFWKNKQIRTALIVHAAYFSVFPMMFEGALDVTGAILDKLNLNSFGHIPEKPDNLFWLMSNLCGELFFVAVVAYVMMASLSAVPRWTLLVPLAQVGAAHATLCPHIASSTAATGPARPSFRWPTTSRTHSSGSSCTSSSRPRARLSYS